MEPWFLELMKQKCKKNFFNSLLLPQVLVTATLRKLGWAATLRKSRHPQMHTPLRGPGGTTSENALRTALGARPQVPEL